MLLSTGTWERYLKSRKLRFRVQGLGFRVYGFRPQSVLLPYLFISLLRDHMRIASDLQDVRQAKHSKATKLLSELRAALLTIVSITMEYYYNSTVATLVSTSTMSVQLRQKLITALGLASPLKLPSLQGTLRDGK